MAPTPLALLTQKLLLCTNTATGPNGQCLATANLSQPRYGVDVQHLEGILESSPQWHLGPGPMRFPSLEVMILQSFLSIPKPPFQDVGTIDSTVGTRTSAYAYLYVACSPSCLLIVACWLPRCLLAQLLLA